MSAAKLAKVQAELELAKTHLGFTEIRAPFDGLIGRFGDIRLGSLLDENQLLTTLSDTHRLWVYFNVPEAVPGLHGTQAKGCFSERPTGTRQQGNLS